MAFYSSAFKNKSLSVNAKGMQRKYPRSPSLQSVAALLVFSWVAEGTKRGVQHKARKAVLIKLGKSSPAMEG